MDGGVPGRPTAGTQDNSFLILMKKSKGGESPPITLIKLINLMAYFGGENHVR